MSTVFDLLFEINCAILMNEYQNVACGRTDLWTIDR